MIVSEPLVLGSRARIIAPVCPRDIILELVRDFHDLLDMFHLENGFLWGVLQVRSFVVVDGCFAVAAVIEREGYGGLECFKVPRCQYV